MPRIKTSITTILLALLAASIPLSGMTRSSIVIDGDMSDWNRVLVDPENALADEGSFGGDPDNPNADRDLRGFAVTWDATNLYFWFRRTLSGNNTITFSVYLDLDFDGSMSSTDRIARYRFSGASFQGATLHVYDDGGTPDPITGDGVAMPGGVGPEVAASMAGAGSVSGIQLEGSLDWASLGLAPDSPMNFHISAGATNNIADNMAAFDNLFSRIRLRDDGFASVAPGADAWIPHTLRNEGNGRDSFDLFVEATQVWDHALWSDPDGDGDPSDGELMALDANGDGDYEDPFDTGPSAAFDADADGIVDTGLLDPGQEVAFVLVVRPPADAADGELDEISLTARSANVAFRQASLHDEVVTGRLTILPDREALTVAGMPVEHAHRACNATTADEPVELEVSSLESWAYELRSDPNGDGDSSDGAPLQDDADGDTHPEIVLPAGSCVDLVLRVTPPPGALAGEQDVHELRAVSAALAIQSAVFDVSTVAQGVTVGPDRSVDSSIGGTVYYRHVIVNGLERDEAFDLTTTSSAGSVIDIYPDPDEDGIPEDQAPITSTGVVPANGGRFPVVLRAQTPASALHGQQDIVELRATAGTDPTTWDVATDTTFISNLLTFSDPLFARPSTSFFGVCARVYAEGSGLAVNDDFRFVWNDPDTLDGAERTTGIREPDADGRIDDVYPMTTGDLPGIWQARLQIRSGSNWENLTVGGARNFTIQAGGGTIEALEPGRVGLFIQGDSFAVSARIANPTEVDFLDTVLRYVLFEDMDGDGLPTDGERYVLADGSWDYWAPGGFTHRTQPVRLFREEELVDFWRVTNVQFPTSGEWTLYAAWQMRCGAVIDARTTRVSVCATLPTADAGPDGPICRGVPTSIGTPAVAGHSYRWFPGDGLDDPDLAEPMATLQQDRDYTLVVVEDATGCSNTDALSLVVVENPVPDVQPDAPVVNVGGTVTLDAGVDAAAYTWSTSPAGQPGDGAATRTIDVSPSEDTLYTVVVESADGCTGQAQETVTVNPNPPAPIVQASGDVVCLGEEVDLDAGVATASYLWETDPAGQPGDGATTRSITVAPSETTTYTVTATDDFGQQGTDELTVTVLTTTPGSTGNALRVTKEERDVLLSWQAVPDGWTFTVYRDDRHDWATPALQEEQVPTDFRDSGAIDDGVRLYLYNVRAKACFEGPR